MWEQKICHYRGDGSLGLQKICHYRGDGPLGLQKFEAPEFIDNWHVKFVSLSVLRTGRLYLPPSKIFLDSWYSLLLEAAICNMQYVRTRLYKPLAQGRHGD
jgi:hypothetical protein